MLEDPEYREVSVSIEDWVDYLIVGRDQVFWFSANEDDPEYEGPPSWHVRNAGIVAYGRGAPQEMIGEDIKGDVVEALANGALGLPLTKYRCVLIDASQTVVNDPLLTGFYAVRWLGSSYEHSEISDIKGYDLFLVKPSGYVIMVVQRGDGRPDVEFVIRPRDVPEDRSMMDILDAAMEAVGLDIIDGHMTLIL